MKKYGFTSLILLLVLAFVSLNTDAKTSELSRITTPFDADWRFLKGNAKSAEKSDFNDSAWRKLNVPHDWSIEGPFDENNPTGGGGGFLPSGVSWYRKHFTVPEKDKARRFFIEFDGVMGISDVWINGVHLGTRPSGYISFEYELSEHLNFGKDNVIAVRADTSLQPASRWYTGAGIYRHVRLVAKDAVYIPQYGTVVTIPQVDEKQAVIKVSSEVVNQSGSAQSVSMQVDLIDPNGKIVVSEENKSVSLAPGQTTSFGLELKLQNPQLWHVEKGILYQAIARIRSGNKIFDEENVPFGIREFHFDAKTGFWLNGKNFKVKGVCIHHDGSAFGAAVPLSVWERRFKELRRLGANAIRTAHNPPAPEFLDLADRMGFLVMDELFDQWTVAKNPYDYHLYFNEWSRRDVTDTVRRDRNHPSIILWSAGNEIHDTPKPEIAIPILKGLVETFHANDPTRPVTQGLFRPNVSKDYDNGLADLLDVVGQNYREKEILAAHKQKPTRKIIGTENTHELSQWLAVRDNPEYSGHFVWSGIDYLGETAKYPTVAYNSGLLYKTATPRPVAFQRQSWWTTEPMVYLARRVAQTPKLPTDPGYNPVEERRPTVLFSDWTPANLQSHEENVEIYSNCEEVELFLNGRSLGKKSKPADDSPRNWKVNFEAGTIKAVGLNGGKIAANYELRTAGKPARILLSVDKSAISNNWDDVAFVTLTVTDENGTLIPNADNLITFKTEGAGIIAAVDSADNNSHESYQAATRRAYNGICFAMLKANSGKGKITLTAAAPNLQSSSITVNVAKAK
ncbi:MAG TPA: glycoside hydrolase family 2 TIM barrel-domain containing protein [Pyrinomonadaceae bacterium]|nr:glycoside hydrolase family 2 TIM barrel-domain containing protein [Pyrinomonadaceae bacterium]